MTTPKLRKAQIPRMYLELVQKHKLHDSRGVGFCLANVLARLRSSEIRLSHPGISSFMIQLRLAQKYNKLVLAHSSRY